MTGSVILGEPMISLCLLESKLAIHLGSSPVYIVTSVKAPILML